MLIFFHALQALNRSFLGVHHMCSWWENGWEFRILTTYNNLGCHLIAICQKLQHEILQHGTERVPCNFGNTARYRRNAAISAQLILGKRWEDGSLHQVYAQRTASTAMVFEMWAPIYEGLKGGWWGDILNISGKVALQKPQFLHITYVTGLHGTLSSIKV